jgi:hypothetical protein
MAEFGRFGQIRFQSILRLPVFSQQIFQKNLEVGLNRLNAYYSSINIIKRKIDFALFDLNILCLLFRTEKIKLKHDFQCSKSGHRFK